MMYLRAIELLKCVTFLRSVPFELESENEIVQSYPTFCDPMNCSLPGSSVHGIVQARVLEWGCHFLLQGIFLTQGSKPGLRIVGRCFTVRATREAELEDMLKRLPGSKAESQFHNTELRFQYHVLVG